MEELARLSQSVLFDLATSVLALVRMSMRHIIDLGVVRAST